MSDIDSLEDTRNRAFRRVHPAKKAKKKSFPPAQTGAYTSPHPRPRKPPARRLNVLKFYGALTGDGTKVLD